MGSQAFKPAPVTQSAHYYAACLHTQVDGEYALAWRATQQSFDQLNNFSQQLASNVNIANVIKMGNTQFTRPAGFKRMKLCLFYDTELHCDALSIYSYRSNLSTEFALAEQDVCEFVFMRENRATGRTELIMDSNLA